MFICDISVFNKYGKQKLDELLSPQKLNWRELVVLLVIERIPGITQALLNPFLQTDKANVTKLLQTMEKKGLIKRVSDEQDKRNKVCTLTLAGTRLLPNMHEILIHWESACFQGLDDDELASYRRINEKITRNLLGDNIIIMEY